MCLIPLDFKEWEKFSDTNCGPLSITTCSGSPNLAKITRRIPMGFGGCSFLHNKHFWPLRMSINSNEKHRALKRTSKVQMYSLLGLIWPCPWLYWSNSWEMFNSLTGNTAFDHFLYCFIKTRPPDVTSFNRFHSTNTLVVFM